eukprot:798605-Pyramimonas_sp.AAC.1
MISQSSSAAHATPAQALRRDPVRTHAVHVARRAVVHASSSQRLRARRPRRRSARGLCRRQPCCCDGGG